MEYNVNQVVAVRPAEIEGADFGIPALVMAVTDDGHRRDVRYASGKIENVGVGNIRPAEKWMQSSYWRMAADCAGNRRAA